LIASYVAQRNESTKCKWLCATNGEKKEKDEEATKTLASIIIWRFDDQHVDDDNQIKEA